MTSQRKTRRLKPRKLRLLSRAKVDDMKAQELREALSERGLVTTGRKAELVSHLWEALQ